MVQLPVVSGDEFVRAMRRGWLPTCSNAGQPHGFNAPKRCNAVRAKASRIATGNVSRFAKICGYFTQRFRALLAKALSVPINAEPS